MALVYNREVNKTTSSIISTGPGRLTTSLLHFYKVQDLTARYWYQYFKRTWVYLLEVPRFEWKVSLFPLRSLNLLLKIKHTQEY